VSDALAVLDVVDMSALEGEARDAVGLLALVAGQDVEPGDHEGTWRIARRTAPDRVISMVDPDSRHVHKTVRSYRDGYKAHIVVEPVTGLICGQQLTAGNAPDGPTGVELMANEPASRQVLARLRLRVRRDTGSRCAAESTGSRSRLVAPRRVRRCRDRSAANGRSDRPRDGPYEWEAKVTGSTPVPTIR
jgi:hypothetical protein